MPEPDPRYAWTRRPVPRGRLNVHRVKTPLNLQGGIRVRCSTTVRVLDPFGASATLEDLPAGAVPCRNCFPSGSYDEEPDRAG